MKDKDKLEQKRQTLRHYRLKQLSQTAEWQDYLQLIQQLQDDCLERWLKCKAEERQRDYQVEILTYRKILGLLGEAIEKLSEKGEEE